ncbi:uncharacterized protein VP01_1621g4 [Puccinia sorghi]|uniref:CCHC-type domain-containing protein n=1 Tax=Puccinia sorghi TaxID=27349 RepID=A0A0L6VH03_9BASI|nr:uncharacterized protein VP01_1621g4 [Puccinia sorghi]
MLDKHCPIAPQSVTAVKNTINFVLNALLQNTGKKLLQLSMWRSIKSEPMRKYLLVTPTTESGHDKYPNLLPNSSMMCCSSTNPRAPTFTMRKINGHYTNQAMKFSSTSQHLKPKAFFDMATYGTAMRDLFSVLKDMNIEFTTNHILGTFLQLNLRDGLVKTEFSQCVKAKIYSFLLSKNPGFDKLLNILYSVNQQASFTGDSSSQFSVTEPPSSFNVLMRDSTTSPEVVMTDNKIISANAARSGNCHICKQPGHWSTECPHCQKHVLIRKNLPNHHQPYFKNNSSPFYPSIYCPIVVSPNFAHFNTCTLTPPLPCTFSPVQLSYPTQNIPPPQNNPFCPDQPQQKSPNQTQ